MAYDAEATHNLTSSTTTPTSNSLTTGGTDAPIIGFWVSWGGARELSNNSGTVWWEDEAAAADGYGFAYRTTDAAGSYSISLTGASAEQWSVIAKSFTFTGGGGGGSALLRMMMAHCG